MSETPQGAPPAAEPAGRPRRRRRALGRWTRRAITLAIAGLCGLVVTFFTVDIGDWFSIRTRAEKTASGYMNDRPVHIGRVSAYITPGKFAIDDLRIDGRSPGDRPFLVAKRVTCHVQWLPLLQHRVVLEVDMTGWDMLVEQWADGTTSMPRFGKDKPGKKLPVEVRASWVYAKNGRFTYEDHGTPWSVVAPGLNVYIVWADIFKKYVGTAKFSNGTVQILDFLPMRTDFSARLSIEGGKPVQIENIDLVTDGAVTRVKGVVDFARWPEQRYEVDSHIQFARMRELFFAHDAWRVDGDGHFVGQFHLFKGGRELAGDFTSATAVLHVSGRDLPFPALAGSLFWSRDRFDVAPASAGFFGGTTRFSYGLTRLGQPGGATATFAADYDGVDVGALSALFHWKQIQVDGRATGRQTMSWSNGRLGSTVTGDGELRVAPPAPARLAGSELPAPLDIPARESDEREVARVLGVVPVGGDAVYRLDPDGLDFSPSWAATPSSYAGFQGRYEFGSGQLAMPVHIASTSAQESDRLLAAILTEKGAATHVIPVGGVFTFDGRVTDTFSALRAAGRFSGDSIYAFSNTWGRTTGDIVLQNNFVDVADGRVDGATPGSRMDINGRFMLGYRKPPAGEEMRATIHVERWPLEPFKRAFNLVDWPITGTGSADLRLHGPYSRLLGDGALQIVAGTAWGESFDDATGTLAFQGTGLAVNPLRVTKGPGTLRGTTSINWSDDTYTFNVDGTGVRLDSLSAFSSDKAKLSGVLGFHAEGQSSFAAPAYTFRGSIPDLFIGDQGVGPVAGSLTVRNRLVTVDQLEMASPLGQASGHGTIAFDGHYTSDLSLTFAGTSIDPFFKFFTTSDWYQRIRVIIGGSVRVRGPLADPAALDVQAALGDARLTLFDYELHNGSPFVLSYQNRAATIGRPDCADPAAAGCHVEIVSADGVETQLQLSGSISADQALFFQARGSASLAILRAFKGFGDVTASGTATLDARLAGDLGDPHFSGTAQVNHGSVKFPWMPRTLENLSGPITVNATGVDFDGVKGQMGDGAVAFGGSIGFKDYKPEEFGLTLTGTGVNLRGYPKGFDSTVDARLWLRGPFQTPTLGGDVDVQRVRLQTQIEPDVSLIALAAAGGSQPTAADLGAPIDSTMVIKTEVHIHAAPMRFVDTHDLWVTGSTDDLTIRGTIDRPIVSGRIDVTGGEWFFSSNRFRIQPGSIEFSNPAKFDPFFHIQAEANSRSQGQTFHVTLKANGTLDKPAFDVSSEPWLPQNDIYALLLGGAPNFNTAEIRELRSPQTYETQLMATLTAQFLAAKSGVGNIFEKAFPLDTVQLTPTLLSGDVSSQTLNPSARLTLGKRISDRVYLIYSRDLTGSGAALNDFIVLQFDQNDRLQWVLSRNEDRSFALDFRFRHVF